jgi:hypothetical protein
MEIKRNFQPGERSSFAIGVVPNEEVSTAERSEALLRPREFAGYEASFVTKE